MDLYNKIFSIISILSVYDLEFTTSCWSLCAHEAYLTFHIPDHSFPDSWSAKIFQVVRLHLQGQGLLFMQNSTCDLYDKFFTLFSF
jgi:hypothetical protein